jgi:hypothetical protein
MPALAGFTPAYGQGVAEHTTSRLSDEAWSRVKLAVALEAAPDHTFCSRSIGWWLNETRRLPAPTTLSPITIDGDLTEPLDIPEGTSVHVRGNVSAPLRVGQQSEAVIGGSITTTGRVDAAGITTMYVHGNLDGVVTATGWMRLVVRGSVHGEVRTGVPTMQLKVGGNLDGTVRPEGKAALLFLSVGGYAASAVLKAIDSHQYNEFHAAIGSSDLAPGIHPLWTGRSGFVAVAGAGARSSGDNPGW